MSYRRSSRKGKEEAGGKEEIPADTTVADESPLEAKRRRLSEGEGEGGEGKSAVGGAEDSPSKVKKRRLSEGEEGGEGKDPTATVAEDAPSEANGSAGVEASMVEGAGAVREVESSHKTQIRIAEAPESGEYIRGALDILIDNHPFNYRTRLTNESDEDLRVGYWLLKATKGEKEVFFKFHSKTVIPANSSFTVYGKTAAVKETTPSCSFTMKKKWPQGAETKVYLYNEKKLLVASLTPKADEDTVVSSRPWVY